MEPAPRTSRSTRLQVVHPEGLRPAPGVARDGHLVALLSRACPGGLARWVRGVSALYRAGDPDSIALAEALGDYLWLRPRVLVPDGMPVLHWAGALDQLGRQHAGGEVIVVAPHASLDGALQHLLRSGRAAGVRRLGDGHRELGLEDGIDITIDSRGRSHHDASTGPHAKPAPVRHGRDCARGG